MKLTADDLRATYVYVGLLFAMNFAIVTISGLVWRMTDTDGMRTLGLYLGMASVVYASGRIPYSTTQRMGSRGVFIFTAVTGLTVPLALQFSYGFVVGLEWKPFLISVYLFASGTTALLSLGAALVVPKKLHGYVLESESE